MRTHWIILLALGLSPTVALAKPSDAPAAPAAEARKEPAQAAPAEKKAPAADAAPSLAVETAGAPRSAASGPSPAPTLPDAAASSPPPAPPPPDAGASAPPSDPARSNPAIETRASGAPPEGDFSLMWIVGGVLLIAGAAGAFWWSTRRASTPTPSGSPRTGTPRADVRTTVPRGSPSGGYAHGWGSGVTQGAPGATLPVPPTGGHVAGPVDEGPVEAPQPYGDIEVAGEPGDQKGTFVETPIEATRAGTGAHAPLIEFLDRGLSDLQGVLTQPDVAARHDKGERDLGHLDYFVRLLIIMSDHGAATHQSRFSEDRVVSSPDEWLDVFAPSVLDVFSTRATELLLAGLEGDEAAARAGEAYRDFLQYTVPEVLRLMDLTAVPAFPLAGNTPDGPGVKVMGRVRQSGFTGQVVGVNQYGILRGRVVVREAHVTTGS